MIPSPPIELHALHSQVPRSLPNEFSGDSFMNTQVENRSTAAALRKLQASEEKYRALFDLAPMAVFVCDRNAVIQEFNQYAVELWGRQPQRGVEKHCGSVRLFLPGGAWLPHEKSPIIEVLRTGEAVRDVEVFIERPDRTRLPVLVNFAALKNAADEIVGAVTSFVDLTARKKAEAQLRESELRYRTLFESIEEGFCVMEVFFNDDGVAHDALFVEVNAAFKTQTGLSDVVGKTVRQLALGDADVWLRAYGLVASTGEPLRWEAPTQSFKRWFDVCAFRIGPPDRRSVAILFKDVSARKAVEFSLRDTHARLVAGATAASVGTWVWEIPANRVFADSFLAKLFHVSPEDADGGPLEVYLNNIHPDDSPRVKAMIDHAVEKGVGFAAECRLHSGEEWRWFAARGELERDDKGQALRFVGALIDITERRRQDEKVARLSRLLKAQTEMFDLTLSHITDFAYTFNREGRFVFVNRALLDLWGLSLEEAIGKNFFDLNYPAELAARMQRQIQLVIETKKGLTDENVYTSETGVEGHYEYIFQPVLGTDGEVTAVTGSTREITDRKRSEKTLRDAEERAREAAQRLADSQQELEIRVHQRTADLDASNTALAAQILEARRAEGARLKLQSQLASSQEDERSRISRELHDEVGQLLVALQLELTALEMSGVSEVGALRCKAIRSITDTVAREIHEVAHKLRPTALDDLGLVRTLSNYINEWSDRTKISTELHVGGLENTRLPAAIETAIYRIVQEALNNVLRHAYATRVSVILEREPELVRVFLEDDGRGFALESLAARKNARRLGILGMKERAALLGGEVKIESEPARGTTIFLRIPISGNEVNDVP